MSTTEQPLILIVDDDGPMRRAASRLLGLAAVKSLQAASPSEALELVAREPGIVGMLIDLEMPEMDGVELMQRVCAIRPDMKMGLWSASDRLMTLTPEDLAPARFALAKGGSTSTLVRTVRRALLGLRDEQLRDPLESGFVLRDATKKAIKNGSDHE
ncbi:MAG: response regulator [Sandaracinaceae bacterium]|nr:response regulator [Sandaracinaceae bacterium]